MSTTATPVAVPGLHEQHDLPAEEAALAAALQNDAACEYVVTHARDTDFYGEDSRAVMRAVANLHTAGHKVDAVTVRAAVCAGKDEEDAQRLREYVGHLAGALTVAANVAEYCGLIVGWSDKRRALAAADAITAATLSANGNVNELPACLDTIIAETLAEMRACPSVAVRSASRAFVDWDAFWGEEEQPEWVYPDILARGRGHAIYAVHKAGKSLLALFLAAHIATAEAHHVLYVDYEMTAHDVRERLADMGYGPHSDLSRLHYALLPSLPPLDTAAGGEALMRLLDAATAGAPAAHTVVIIDTISRAVSGEENSADTWRLFYIHTGLRLKQRGVTWLRLDHGGKDPTQGQRGSSGKGDDVDVVWKLQPSENGITLKRELARMAWVPETVQLLQEDFPLRYLPAACDWPVGTAEVANLLDRLGVALDASVRTAGTELRKAGEGRRTTAVAAALKWRREKAADQFRPAGKHPGKHPSEATPETDEGNAGEQPSLSLGNTAGNTGKQGSRASGKHCVPLKGDTVSQPHADALVTTSGTVDGFDF